MTFTENQINAQKALHSIYAKCWEDENFKQQLITSPQSAIESMTGKPANLPAGMKVVVNDQTDPNTVYINLPAKPNFDDLALSDEQLEMVAGGEVAVSTFLASVSVGLAIVGLVAGVYYATH